MKSAVFERQQGQSELALKTVTTALSKYPKFAKLYMVQGQIHQAANNYSAARAAYAAGIKAAPKDITLRVLASGLEEADGKSIRARALLEKARLVNPKSDVLWAEAVRVEERSGAPAQGVACACAARMPIIRHTLVDGNLVRGPAATQGTQCGRAQEM
jgi:pre-mRNA-processing factor 6